MAKTRNIALAAGLGVVALFTLGAGNDAPTHVATPTPAVVTLAPSGRQAVPSQRIAPRRRPTGHLDENDRGVILLLLLSTQPPR